MLLDHWAGILRLNTNGAFIPESQSVCKLQVRLTILVSCSFSERLHFQFGWNIILSIVSQWLIMLISIPGPIQIAFVWLLLK